MSAEPVSWHALDFAAAVLTGDAEGRERALDDLVSTPRESLYALGTLLLTIATPGARQQIGHMLAMTSLRALVDE